jgi:hypothetical protein
VFFAKQVTVKEDEMGAAWLIEEGRNIHRILVRKLR